MIQTDRNWFINETTFDPHALPFKESLFTIGNGYLGTRGAFEEGYPGAEPFTLVHGVFDDAPVVNTELANAPNWLPFALYVEGERFRMDRGAVLAYRRTLDLHDGTLRREVRWESPTGRIVEIGIERFASLAHKHLLAIRYRVTPVNFTGELEFRAGLNAYSENQGLLHWNLEGQELLDDQSVYLQTRTRATGIALGQAARLSLNGSAASYTALDCDGVPTLVARVSATQGETLVADKLVALTTGRETADVRAAALEQLHTATAQGYPALRAANARAWVNEWQKCNITIEGDDEADLALRYSLFQLLIAAPRDDDRVSIPAKTLSGFGYRGHVFWDTEIFLLPFFTCTRPDIARNLLAYRYHTLPGARRKAQAAGYEGAMIAWESAATGDETTPRWVPGPQGEELVRIWCGDIELHINADVAYAVHTYWRITGDATFMRDYGAEIILDTARFWGSRAEWNAAASRYEISDVIGPDEYHDHVDNNAFTNQMARWNLQTALDVLAWLRATAPAQAAALAERLDLTPARLEHWADVIARLYTGYDPETGLIEQFAGFFARRDLDQTALEPRAQSVQALFGIEETQTYQVLKQPDVLMLLYLLPELYNREILIANWEYYTPRTDLSYGSSLGPAIQAALAARLGHSEEAYRHFIHAARTDLQDARGNTAEGLHAATAGGLWQAVVFGFAGLTLTDKAYTLKPQLPSHWKRVRFTFTWQGKPIQVDLSNPIAEEKERG